MVHYRLYRRNRSSGRIDRAEVIEAEDDARAVAIVKAQAPEGAVELWQERRKIIRLEGSKHPFAIASLSRLPAPTISSVSRGHRRLDDLK